MAITQCPECSRDVSDEAVSCPQCGYPVKKDLRKRKRTKMQWGGIERVRTCIYVAIPLFILGGIWLLLIVRFFPEATLKDLAYAIPTIIAGVMFIVGSIGMVLAIVSLSEVGVLWVWNKLFN